MSVKYMAAVWDMDLPRNTGWVLMAYADHADHQGRNIRPGTKLMAYKTGLSERTVQRVTQELLECGILRVQEAGGGRGQTTVYRIDLDAAPMKEPPEKGDTVSPFTEKGDIAVTPIPVDERVTKAAERVTESGERVTKTTEKGDTAMSPQPYEPINPPEPINTTAALSARAREDPEQPAAAAAVLSTEQEVAIELLLEACPDFANPVGLVRAHRAELVAAWAVYVSGVMTRDKRNRIKSLSGYLVRNVEAGEAPVLPGDEARLFADRVALARDGVWPADSPWRPVERVDAVDAVDGVDGPQPVYAAPPATLEREARDYTWEVARSQLRLQMTRSTFDTWVRDTDGVRDGDRMTVLVANKYALDWLSVRLKHVILKTLRSIEPAITAVEFQVRGA